MGCAQGFLLQLKGQECLKERRPMRRSGKGEDSGADGLLENHRDRYTLKHHLSTHHLWVQRNKTQY